MKKLTITIIAIIIASASVAQINADDKSAPDQKETRPLIGDRKSRGFYSTLQISLLMGNHQYVQRYYPSALYSSSSSMYPRYSAPYIDTRFSVSPSFTLSGGYRFNEHWAAGAGIGIEIFDHNLYPLFAELKYTLWDHRISPYLAMKGGYAFGNFKAKHYEDLWLNWRPYYIEDATLRNFGGLMLHPEIGVKVPLYDYCDILFSAAYRYQEKRSVAHRELPSDQFDEWEHNEKLNKLSFGIAIMFR